MHLLDVRLNGMTVLVVVFLLAVGCGEEHDYGPTGRIEGRLTMEGQPLPDGTKVMFMQHEEGFLAFGPTDADGNFKIESWNDGNMPVGKYKVMIQPAGEAGQDVENMSAEERLEHKPAKKQPDSAGFPKRYRSITTSKLEYTVAEGPNHFEIDIKSK